MNYWADKPINNINPTQHFTKRTIIPQDTVPDMMEIAVVFINKLGKIYYNCSLCREQTAYLKSHVQNHFNNFPFCCHICSQQCESFDLLVTHVNTCLSSLSKCYSSDNVYADSLIGGTNNDSEADEMDLQCLSSPEKCRNELNYSDDFSVFSNSADVKTGEKIINSNDLIVKSTNQIKPLESESIKPLENSSSSFKNGIEDPKIKSCCRLPSTIMDIKDDKTIEQIINSDDLVVKSTNQTKSLESESIKSSSPLENSYSSFKNGLEDPKNESFCSLPSTIMDIKDDKTIEQITNSDDVVENSTNQNDLTINNNNVKLKDSPEVNELGTGSVMNIQKKKKVLKRKTCEICGGIFAKLHIHMRTHTGEKPYKCTMCEKAFAINRDLRDHMFGHTGVKSYQCSICGNAYYAPSGLRAHMRTHTNTRPFKCELCAKSFHNRTHLKIHLRTHSNVRPFQCDQCDQRFRQSGALKSHLLMHLDERRFICHICSQAFVQSSSLNRHLKCVHHAL